MIATAPVVSDAGPLLVLAKLNLLYLLKELFDRGERDTLALAEILGSKSVLMDETAGRQIARARGLTVRGSLGVLIEAYHCHLISSDQLRLNLAEIASRQDIWVNPQLVERLLHRVLGG